MKKDQPLEQLEQPATAEINMLPQKPIKEHKKSGGFISFMVWFFCFLLLVGAAGGTFYFYLETTKNNPNDISKNPSVTPTPTEITPTVLPPPTVASLIGIWQAGPTLESGWNERYQFYKSGKYRHMASSVNCAERNKEDAGFWMLSNGKLTLVPIIDTRLVGGSEATATGSCSSAVMIKGGSLAVFRADYNPLNFDLVTVSLADPITDESTSSTSSQSSLNSHDSVKFSSDYFWKYFSDSPNLYNTKKSAADYEEPVFSRYLKDDIFYTYKGTWKRTDPAQSDFELMLNTDGAYVYGGYCVKSLNVDTQECVYDYSLDLGVGIVGFIHDGEAYMHYKTLNGSTGEAIMSYDTTTRSMTWRVNEGNDSSVVPAVAVLTFVK